MTLSHTLAVYSREARAHVLATARTPQFLVPTVGLPVMFFALFGVAFAHGHVETTRWLLGTYAVFAAVGPALFGFGAGVAAEREARLLELKRASPMPAGAYAAGRLAAAVAATAVALLLIFATAAAAGVRMPPWRWAALLALGAGSAIPFALIGLNLGLRLGSQGATAAANLLFLVFCMLGGLWVPLSQAPAWMGRAAWVLPSFHLGLLAQQVAGVRAPEQVGAHTAIVAGIAAAAAVGAWRAWRREEA